MTKSMFKEFDNEDGYVTVLCLRDRYIKDLESLGFVDSTDKLTAPEVEEAPKPIDPIKQEPGPSKSSKPKKSK